VIYTDVWTSMGQEEELEQRRARFANYQVNAALLAQAPTHARVMHCLPARRGEEATSDVLDGDQSIVFQQAGNRLHTQKALLKWLLTGTSLRFSLNRSTWPRTGRPGRFAALFSEKTRLSTARPKPLWQFQCRLQAIVEVLLQNIGEVPDRVDDVGLIHCYQVLALHGRSEGQPRGLTIRRGGVGEELRGLFPD